MNLRSSGRILFSFCGFGRFFGGEGEGEGARLTVEFVRVLVRPAGPCGTGILAGLGITNGFVVSSVISTSSESNGPELFVLAESIGGGVSLPGVLLFELFELAGVFLRAFRLTGGSD